MELAEVISSFASTVGVEIIKSADRKHVKFLFSAKSCYGRIAEPIPSTLGVPSEDVSFERG